MDGTALLSLTACAGILALAVLVLWRGSRSPLSVPLGLWCLDLFAWNFATLAFNISGHLTWRWLDVIFSPFTPPLALHVILVFTGRLRQLRWLLLLSYLLFGLLSISSAAAFTFPWARSWVDSSAWSMVYLAGWIPLGITSLALLVLHLRRTDSPLEQMRTRLVLAALAVGGLLGSTELWNDMLALPALGHLGALGSSLLLTLTVLRLRLLGDPLSLRAGAYALALATLGIVGYLAVFRWLSGDLALMALGVGAVTLALLAAARDLFRARTSWNERVKSLALLGRYSAQMAHDLKNPLAALKGALQFLETERQEGRSLDGHHRFVQIMLEQVTRMEGVLRTYVHEPVLAPLQTNEVIRSVLSLSRFAALGADDGGGVQIITQLADGLPPCRADPIHLSRALENLLRNSLEAMPDGGVLTVRTSCAPLHGDPGGVQISVEDTGVGMDARQQARAFTEYHSEKGSSGLGLSFVRRVAEQHNGEVYLQSALGNGTTVQLHLPATGETER